MAADHDETEPLIPHPKGGSIFGVVLGRYNNEPEFRARVKTVTDLMWSEFLRVNQDFVQSSRDRVVATANAAVAVHLFEKHPALFASSSPAASEEVIQQDHARH